MPVAACIGNSTARWSIETLHTIESGVFVHDDPEFLGGGSAGIWEQQISPQGGKWDQFETDVDNAGGVDAVWLMMVVRDPSVFPGEPYMTRAQIISILDHARTITGNVPYFVNAVPPFENCNTASPGVGGSSSTSEATYGSYARQPADRDSGSPWWSVTNGVATPSADVNFPKATSGSETVTHVSLCKNSGELIAFGVLNPAILVESGKTPIVKDTTTFTLV